MSLCGGKEQIGSIHQRLLSQESDTSLWRVTKDCEQLFFNAALWPLINFSHVRLKVSYSGTSLKTSVSFLHPFKEVALNKKKKVVIERHIEQPGIWLEGEQVYSFGQEFVRSSTCLSTAISDSLPQDMLSEIRSFESFIPGLAPYY